jgi:hypothetical protein
MLVYLYTRHSSGILIIVTMMEPQESISKKRKFNVEGHENNEDGPLQKVARNEQPSTASSLAFWEQARNEQPSTATSLAFWEEATDYLTKTFHQQYKDNNCA